MKPALTVPCPCCGNPLRVPANLKNLHRIPMTPQQRAYVWCIVRAHPHIVTAEEIEAAVWPSGRSSKKRRSLLQHINVLQAAVNKHLMPLGWRITSAFNGVGGTRRLMEWKASGKTHSVLAIPGEAAQNQNGSEAGIPLGLAAANETVVLQDDFPPSTRAYGAHA